MARRAQSDQDSKEQKGKNYTAPALDKGLDILELLAGEPDGLNRIEIAKRLGRSVSELFRMLVVLEQRDYLVLHADTDRYQLSLKLFDLSHQHPPVKRLTSAAKAVMKHLAHSTGQSCHLVIYYEGKGHVLVQQDAPSARIFSVRLGAEAPLVDTCSGHILLAFADEMQRSSMLACVPKGHKKVNKKMLDELSDRICSQGHESISSAQIQGVVDLGCPVFDHNGYIAAALVVPFLSYMDDSHPKSIDETLEQVKLAAAEISDALGYRSE
ncbi:IclR family transcriptional regulator [Porticoccus sp. W117]|uniref:IclR family transcriptional regulator n=1 Tax=Porticoccus sp. W117 TaxID=3054777 RepID=UPI002592ABE1|nr:IclR family transcriptional regulator [Porticoccus sp. W117]MDM3872116.1 IclR family transcriptional regulator [Porticoccus sp. W117]